MSSQKSLTQSLIDEGYLKTLRLIDAFGAINRADFVLPKYKNEAYDNYPLPIGFDQTISQPLTVAFMLELLDPKPGDIILDIGSGSGWTTALLAQVVGENGKVFALERIPKLCKFGEKNVLKYNFIQKGVAQFLCQNATSEIPDGPYDKILAGAAASKDIPQIWRNKLKINGRIVAPVNGSVWLFIKKPVVSQNNLATYEWEEKEYPGFSFVPLIQESGIKNYKLGDTKKKTYRTTGYGLLAISFLMISVLAYEIYLPHTSFADSKKVIIDTGLGSRKIGELLKKEGIINSKWTFVLYTILTNRVSLLKPGEYIFFNTTTIPEITLDLVTGVNTERLILIPEGWQIENIAAYLEKEKIMYRNNFLKFVNKKDPAYFRNNFTFLYDKPETAGLEGYLFPDTYRVLKTYSPETLIIKMLENFDKKLTPELRQEISKQGKTIFEIITMASLIEKEVVSDEDRAIVSGILWKRLEHNIPLQVDATIIYITGKRAARISREDMQIDSPYNTYKYKGLPKGPIANPGISSIRAAIFPQESPYLYYLSAPDGRTIFSRTLEEHNEAKRKYLR